MRLTPLAYGTLVATAFLGGVAIYYNATPPRTIRAVDVAEIVEGTLERCATLSWGITASTNDAGWGYNATTNWGTNYSYMGVLWGEGGSVKSPGYPGIPIIGSTASRDLLVKTLTIIEHLPTNFVRAYTPTSVVYWTATGLWDHCHVGDGTNLWTVAVTNGIPIYGPATNLSYLAQTAVLYEAYRLLAAMTTSTYTVSITTTGKLYGAVTDDIEWSAEDQFVCDPDDPDPPFPRELEYFNSLDTSSEVLGELFVELASPTNFAQSDGSPAQRFNRLQGYGDPDEGRGAYYFAAVDTRITTYRWRTPAYPPYTWHASGQGQDWDTLENFPCDRREQRSQGYLRFPIADLAGGVTAAVSVSLLSTGWLNVLTGENWGDMTNTWTRPPAVYIASNWTESCSGTITGMVRTAEIQFAPTIRSYFSNFPDYVQAFVAPSTDGGLTYGQWWEETDLQMTEASMWYEIPRPAVVNWTFRYCKP
jgi:hypothetical protein